ncbi:hypothetical protein GH714_025767 [Hevea brasiliensis]|uniref:Uncharacterized protein n=1 Tax=Hevea brasiliensis TaxID=3981 RepID=A0A6A6LSH3_HEVBR|nr:hypothetical protein GH714_025767 [Hevea brasiliensis]
MDPNSVTLLSRLARLVLPRNTVMTSPLRLKTALAAAAWTSLGELEAGRGRAPASSGKLRIADLPLMLNEATSWAGRHFRGGKCAEPDPVLLPGLPDLRYPLAHVRIRTPLYRMLTIVPSPLGLSRVVFQVGFLHRIRG